MQKELLIFLLGCSYISSDCSVGYHKVAVLDNYLIPQSSQRINFTVCEEPTANGSTLFMSSVVNITVKKRVFETYINESTAYLGLGKKKVLESESDLLGLLLLQEAEKSTLTYQRVRSAIPPMAHLYQKVHTFTGTREALVDLTLDVTCGDTGALGIPTPEIVLGKLATLTGVGVREGLLGGHMPLIVFQFPAVGEEGYWEWTVVPYVNTNNNHEVPAVFRAVRVSDGEFHDFKYFDRYIYSAGDLHIDASYYFSKILDNYYYWKYQWEGEEGVALMQTNLENGGGVGALLADQARHSLVRDMISRQEKFWPRYGVQPGYGVFGDNGFQEVFTASMMQSLELGAFNYSTGVLENYFEYYLGRNGSVRYRGLEMAQSARTLTVAAMYYFYTGDPTNLIVKYFDKLNGIVNMLTLRRDDALKLHTTDPRYGMPQGNDEADLWENVVAGQHPQYPFYSIAAEMWRGFRDLATAYQQIGCQGCQKQADRMLNVVKDMLPQLYTSLERSKVSNESNPHTPSCYPYVAGNTACDVVVNAPSKEDSQPWRTQAEAMYSGAIPKHVVDSWYTWNSQNRFMQRIGIASGNSATCCGNWIVTFTAHGYAYGLLQHDMIDEYILNYFAQSAHAYTRGTWTAAEVGVIDRDYPTAPFAAPSQTTAGIYFKWMFLHYEAMNHTIWLGRGIPQELFQIGDELSVGPVSSYYGLFQRLTWKKTSDTTASVSILVPPTMTCTSSQSLTPGTGGCPAGGLAVRIPFSKNHIISKVQLAGGDWPYFNRNSAFFPAVNLTAAVLHALGSIEVIARDS